MAHRSQPADPQTHGPADPPPPNVSPANLPAGSFPVPSATLEGTGRLPVSQTADLPSGSSNQPPKNCSARNASGAACRAFPLRGSTLCAFHDPGYRPLLLQSASRGGRGNRRTVLPLPTQPIDLSTRKGILAAAGHLLYLNLTGQLTEHTARQLGRLVATAERALAHDHDISPEVAAEITAFLGQAGR